MAGSLCVGLTLLLCWVDCVGGLLVTVALLRCVPWFTLSFVESAACFFLICLSRNGFGWLGLLGLRGFAVRMHGVLCPVGLLRLSILRLAWTNLEWVFCHFIDGLLD